MRPVCGYLPVQFAGTLENRLSRILIFNKIVHLSFKISVDWRAIRGKILSVYWRFAFAQASITGQGRATEVM
jgi:hypothetical protein